ncbi:MAG: hypothetical protein FWD23_01225 [Oscillospiraceae bacterium]|nr:hypothetical protein [Oscillospiraceae bacterium]
MNTDDILIKNDFDPSKEISRLLPAIDGGGLPLEFKLSKTGFFDICREKAALTNIGGAITVEGEDIDLTHFEFKAAEAEVTNSGSRHRAEYVSGKYGLSWIWTIFARENDILVMASLKNNGGKCLSVSSWELLRCGKDGGGRIFDFHSDKTTFFKWEPWNMGVELVEDASRVYYSDNIAHIYDPESNTAALIGFLTLSRMKTRHALTVEKGGGMTGYRAQMVFGKYSLKPGETFNSELCAVSFHADPYEALELWAKKVRAVYRPEFDAAAPVGFIQSSWVPSLKSGGDTAQQHNLGAARAIRERLRGFDVDYIWISQTNLKDYIPGNWLAENADEFPNGLKAFFAELNKLGFKPGLWVSPFWFYGEAEGMLKEHSTHLLRGKDGEPMCAEEAWGWKYEDDDLPRYHMHRYNLDGSHPETIGYVRKLFSYYREIGVRYYMLDFLQIDENSVLYDPSKTAVQAGYEILKEIRETAGEDTHIQTAVSSSPGFTGTINAARIGRDFGEARQVGSSLDDWRNASNVLHDEHYANTKALQKNAACNYFTHLTLYQNDLNVLSIDKPYPVEYARFAATMFGLFGGSPVMLGDNIADMDEERLRYIKMCLPRTKHSAKPADLFERVQPGDYSRVIKLSIDTSWDSYLLAGAFNSDETFCDLTLDFKKLGLDAGEQYVVYEFWNEEYCGVFKNSFPCRLPPESCKLYRIAKKRDHPWLLSTDMHIQQGYCEVAELQWDEGKLCLCGSVTRPAGERGGVYILMPRNYKLINQKGAHLLKELLDYSVVMYLPVQFSGPVEKFELFFEEWNFETLSPRGHIPYSTKQEWQEYMRLYYHRQDTRVFE